MATVPSQRRVEPFEAKDLPELAADGVTAELRQAFNDLLIAVNGTPYHGERTNAIALALRWMRANPEAADVLLDR